MLSEPMLLEQMLPILMLPGHILPGQSFGQILPRKMLPQPRTNNIENIVVYIWARPPAKTLWGTIPLSAQLLAWYLHYCYLATILYQAWTEGMGVLSEIPSTCEEV